MLFTLKLFKTLVNSSDTNDRTSSRETIRLLCGDSTSSSGLCAQLEHRIEGELSREEKTEEHTIVSRPQHSCVTVMPVRHPLRQRYYERQYLCPILWRVLVFVMLPRYCLSLAGKSCPIETVLLHYYYQY